MNILSDLSEVEEINQRKQPAYTIIKSHWFFKGDNRLDGGFYAEKAETAMRILENSKSSIEPLSNLVSKIYIISRFKRIYTNNEQFGWPYITPTETLSFRPKIDRFISKENAPITSTLHFSKQGWLLMTASGTIGRLTYVTPRLEKYFLSHDLIRIIPNSEYSSAYLYAYLSTWIGQALITKDKYGGAIKHLEPVHIENVPIPLLTKNIRENISQEIKHVFTLREKANNLLDQSIDKLHELLYLPEFDEALTPYLPQPIDQSDKTFPTRGLKAFSVNLSGLDERFDASYQVPISRAVVKLLRQSKYNLTTIHNLSTSIYLPDRFKRSYVEENYGVPFLQSSHVPQQKPIDLKYISTRVNDKNIAQCIIKKGQILITRSGTIGRIMVVPSDLDGWAASEHLIRISPKNDVNPGYIAAFLESPYGQHQLQSKIYGGVVDELTENDTGNIFIPEAPTKITDEIGNLVINAYDLKYKAAKIENEVIKFLEDYLENPK